MNSYTVILADNTTCTVKNIRRIYVHEHINCVVLYGMHDTVDDIFYNVIRIYRNPPM